MNIKLDENLPDRLVSALIELGHDVDTVYVERLNGRVDDDVCIELGIEILARRCGGQRGWDGETPFGIERDDHDGIIRRADDRALAKLEMFS